MKGLTISQIPVKDCQPMLVLKTHIMIVNVIMITVPDT